MESKVWILNDPPEKEVHKDTFALETRKLPELQNGQVLLKVIFLSNDPVRHEQGCIRMDSHPEICLGTAWMDRQEHRPCKARAPEAHT